MLEGGPGGVKQESNTTTTWRPALPAPWLANEARPGGGCLRRGSPRLPTGGGHSIRIRGHEADGRSTLGSATAPSSFVAAYVGDLGRLAERDLLHLRKHSAACLGLRLSIVN